MQWMLIDENVNGRIIRNLYSRCKRGGVGEREHKRENGGLGARDEKGRSLVPSPQSPIFLPRSCSPSRPRLSLLRRLDNSRKTNLKVFPHNQLSLTDAETSKKFRCLHYTFIKLNVKTLPL